MEKIAIIGFSCLFPDAKNASEFWHNLIEQKDSTSSLSIDEIGIEPTIFYDPIKGTPDKVYSLQGGFVRNFKFDASGYNLPATFLQNLDNTFKWSLYAAKQALHSSGYLENESVLSKCGVLLGTLSLPTKSSNHLFEPIYQQALKPAIRELLQQEEFDFATLPNNEETSFYNAMISGLPAAIVSQALSLSHIHFCLDAACSSPLYATRLASHYLWTHQADLMLAGGISCSDPIFIRMLFSGIQGYPENNDISRPLDKSSRGLITSEGVGMLVLKRYSDAVRDGDRIYATIVGNGLSNDGRGKYLLSPNPKGQTLAFEKAYSEAQLNPKAIDYIECHATGTLLGDSTEFNSVETFFGKYQATPLSGSVKSNLGHLLTGAASASLIKVLLSMNKGIIPTTINITDPIGSEDNVISPSRIVTSPTNWHSKSASIKRAGVSAFGLGGTNAHIILEQNNNSQVEEGSEPLKPVKMAIVGMDAFFGDCDGLDAFERSIYQGKQHFIPLPSQRWHGVENQTELLKKYNLPDGKAPVGAYIKEFEIDTISSKIPPNELEKLNKQQLLMLKVAERALKDADIKEGSNVAVLIATEAELSVHQLQQRWNLSWEIKEGLNNGTISLSSDKVSKLETIVKDGIHNSVDSSEFVSYITNIMASRISSLWNFTAPVFTISAGENSTFKVLEVAQNLLTTGEADAVLVGAVDLAGGMENVLLRSKLSTVNTGVNTLSYDRKANGWIVGEGAGAVVLKRHEVAKQENECIYAVIDAISFTQKNATKNDLLLRLGSTDANAINSVCQQAFDKAEIKPSAITYLEVFGSGISQEDEAEIDGLLRAYPSGANQLNCALGSVKANIGHTYVASGIASLIKTALCLYYRYIPATPKWTGVKDINKWENSSFYVVPESKAWFLNTEANKRTAAINSIGIDGTYAHLIISESPEDQERSSRFLQQMPLHLFPIAGKGRDDLLQQIDNLQNLVNRGTSLTSSASMTFVNYQKRCQENYTLAILARNNKELAKESEAAIKGINNAFNNGEEWQTPLGSYFTAKPLGKRGEVAFVYPAAVNSYLGIGRNLFRLFPQLQDDIILQNLDSRVNYVESLVYPRSLNKLSSRQLEALEKQLLDDSAAMFENEIVVARLLSQILRDNFQVKPKFAFGYSLGEISMMPAIGVWNQFKQGSNSLNSSTLFAGDRLSGAKNAVREFWQLPSKEESPDNNFWCNYVLIATPSQVRESLAGENRVYLTQINTPEEVVIAGFPGSCERVIEKLGCNAFRAPFDHVIHCEAMASEHEEMKSVNSLPVIENRENLIVYSASEYAPIKLESEIIAEGIAKGLCKQLDFPRLVNQVYNDGAKIFIETGAGSVCSRWIDKILNDKEHMTISLNRRGVDDHISIVKALAKLLSHQVDLDLSPLYLTEEESSQKVKNSQKKVYLGNHNFAEKILTPEHKELFQNQLEITQKSVIKAETAAKVDSTPQVVEKSDSSGKFNPETQPETKPNIPARSPKKPEANPMKNIAVSKVENSNKLQTTAAPSASSVASPQTSSASTTTKKLTSTPSVSNYRKSDYQKFNTNNLMIHKTHAKFLQSRQEFSQQMSEIIQLQIACAEHLFEN